MADTVRSQVTELLDRDWQVSGTRLHYIEPEEINAVLFAVARLQTMIRDFAERYALALDPTLGEG